MHGCSRFRRMAIEKLEDRLALATGVFEFNVYQDVDGQPGALVDDPVFEAGERFFLEVTAQEFHPRAGGFGAVAIDLQWDPGVLQEIDEDLSAVVTPSLPLFVGGSVDNSAGTIDDLAGAAFLSSGVGREIGGLRADRFALLHFEAVGPASDTSITMQPGRSGIVTVPVLNLGARHFDFEVQRLRVLPASDVEPPAEAAPVAAGRAETVVAPPPVTNPVETASVDSTAPETTPIEAAPSESIPTETAPPETTPAIIPSPNAAPIDAPPPSDGVWEDGPVEQSPGVTEPVDPVDLTPTPADSPQQPADIPPVDLADAALLVVASASPVTIGESFFIDVLVEDLRSDGAGVGGLAIDLQWDSHVLALAGEFDPQTLVTSQLPMFQTGRLDASIGLIENLGGIALRATGAGRPIGASGSELFARIPFIAIAAADQTIVSASLGAGGIGLTGGNGAARVTAGEAAVSAEPSTAAPTIQWAGSSNAEAATVEFSTPLPDGESRLVRAALPDRRQFVEVTNTGQSTLLISEIRIQAPNVSVIAAPSAVAPGATGRIELEFAPMPSAAPVSFDLWDGLVIESNAADHPQAAVRLIGASTFDADINYDGRASIADVVLLDDHFGAAANESEFGLAIDPNGDGAIDLGDLAPLNAQFGLALPALPAVPATVTQVGESRLDPIPVVAPPSEFVDQAFGEGEFPAEPIDESTLDQLAATLAPFSPLDEDEEEEEAWGPSFADPA